MRNILYLSYGNGVHETDVRSSIISAWRFGPLTSQLIRVIIYTDRPFAFEDLPVVVRTVTEAEWGTWSGEYNYRHRRKICALQDAFREFDGPIALIDGDTWWCQSPKKIFNRIANGRTVMHIREGRLDRVNDPVYLRLAEILNHPALIRSCREQHISSQKAFMWNSGVVGIDRRDSGLLDEVLYLTDTFCSVSTSVHVLEQFAFSHVLASKTIITEASNFVFHYWPPQLRSLFRNIANVSLTTNDAGSIEEMAHHWFANIPRRTRLRQLQLALHWIAEQLGLTRRRIRHNEW